MKKPPAENRENTRDHLANERTFLAWTRTGIAMMGFGFLVAKLRFELSPRMPGSPIGSSTLGILFALAGIITVALATWRYFAVKGMIDTGDFRPLGYGLTLFALLLIAIGVAIILNLGGMFAFPP